jgi:hypothetical protein
MPLFEAVHLAEKHDIGIMSTKGMSVTAARLLVDYMCGENKIPLLKLHDFDISGFSISKTIGSDTARYYFRNTIKIIDLGLRLADVEDLDLQSESVSVRDNPHRTAATLRRNGATSDEIGFLLGGQRVELNAMTSDELIEFVEGKLEEHGIAKVVPSKERLDEAFRLFARGEQVKIAVNEAIEAAGNQGPWHNRRVGRDGASAPEELGERVRDYLKENPESPWEDAVSHIVEEAK